MLQHSQVETTKIIKDGQSFLSDWSEFSIFAPDKPQIPIYVGKDADGEITNHMVMARTKTEEQQLASETKSPKKNIPIRYPFNSKIPRREVSIKDTNAICVTENTVKTDTGRVIHQKLISWPLFQSEKRHRRETVLTVSAEITPKNRHWLRRLDGKYGKWDEILPDILNGKLRIVQNKKRTETDSEDDDDFDDDNGEEEEEIPEERGRVYDTSERDGRYQPIRTDPENDPLQLHTDGQITQGKTKGTPQLLSELVQKPQDFLPHDMTPPGPSSQF